MIITGNHKIDLRDFDVEDFASAAYLAIWIEESRRAGRSNADATKFGIGKYHGAYPMLKKAQEKSDEDIQFLPVEQVLGSGTFAQRDLLGYINEIFEAGVNYNQNITLKAGGMCQL